MSRIGGAVSRAWGIEQSTVDNTPKVSYVRGGELIAENHGGVDSIKDDEIRFGSGITVHGDKLAIDWIEKDYAVVKGEVSMIDMACNKKERKK